MSGSIGRVVRLQVHAEPLKRDGAYVPDALVAVDRAVVNADGMLGWNGNGWIIDTHHSAHPRAKGGGRRVLSIGFTGHYDVMAARFESVPIGIAGENIVVDGPALAEEQIQDGLVIRGPDGTEVELRSPKAAVACTGFTSYLLGSDDVLGHEEVNDELAFLSSGTRGFILSLDHIERPVEVHVGDEVLIR
jgi:hypothetical protein